MEFLDMFPDDSNMLLTIEECSDAVCTSSVRIFYSFKIGLAQIAPFKLPPTSTGFARVTFICLFSPHTQARFVLRYKALYRSDPGTPAATCLKMSPSNWHHVAAVVKLANGSGIESSLYLNGSALTTKVDFLAEKSAGLFYGDSHGFAFGRVSPTSPPFGYLVGDIDDVGVWNRSLSAQNLTALMQAGCRGPFPAVLCFDFEESASTARGSFKNLGARAQTEAVAVDNDRFLPWCTGRDDAGSLQVYYSGACIPYEESWGFCTDRPRLPGLGYDYDEDMLAELNDRLQNGLSLDSVRSLPGCVNTPLVVDGNRAGRYGPLLNG